MTIGGILCLAARETFDRLDGRSGWKSMGKLSWLDEKGERLEIEVELGLNGFDNQG